jgi:LPS sulfotransferase NodH
MLVTQQLISSREAFLQTTSVPFLRVSYDDLVASPDDTVDNICEFLNYKPTLAARSRAIHSIANW